MCQTGVIDRCLFSFHVDDRRAKSSRTVHQTNRDMKEL